MSTISKLSTKVVDDLFNTYPNMFTGVNRSIYVNAFQVALTDVIQSEIQLSRTEPDYERIMLTLTQALSEDALWYDLLTSGTGKAILRMIASGIAYDQFAIMRAFQEAFPETASADSSIMAATRMLGVRPRRRLPARVSVTLTRPDTGTYLEVPRYSVFTVNGVKFFNREKIVFKASSLSVNAYLFQGLVRTETLESTGEPFQRFVLGDGTKTPADADVRVTVNGVEWSLIQEGPWTLERGSYQVYESTTASGDIELSFGNGDYGAVPDMSAIISVTWVETLGPLGNIDASGLPVEWEDMPSGVTVSGITTSNAEGGDYEIKSAVYRKIAPSLRASNNRAVRRSDYKAEALKFAGVKDALFRGQAELAPNRRSMMNVIGVTLLTDAPWTSTQKENFEREFQEKIGIYQLEFLWIDPTYQVQNIVADVYCKPDAPLEDVRTELIAALKELYEFRVNYLGFSIYQTDITDILNGRRASSPSEQLERAIEYVVLDTSVTKDIILTKKTEYVKLGDITLNLHYTTRNGYSGRLDLSPTNLRT